jgi:cell division protease FtsH
VIIAIALAVVATLLGTLALVSGFRRVDHQGSARGGDMDLGTLAQGDSVVRGRQVDVARTRERSRRRRLWKLFVWLAPISAFFYYRLATSNPIRIAAPNLSPTQMEIFLPLMLIMMLSAVMIVPMMSAGKSPHVRFDPSEIDVTMNDVVGIGPVRQEVVNTLNLFLGYQTFREHMGGNPRKAILFEGPPGTGKTYMAKAMAREAGVPYLFVSSTAFQSMYYGQTGRKIRNYFKALRKAAREEGGAIGFIEEIDAIAGARSGMRSSPLGSDVSTYGEINRSNSSEGISGVVNELLIQLQSFDTPAGGSRVRDKFIDFSNRWLPAHRRLQKKPPLASNILVIGATNRAADLDPALLRPGRFDRQILVPFPTQDERVQILRVHFRDKKIDDDVDIDVIARGTPGMSGADLSNLVNEAALFAVRRGAKEVHAEDFEAARDRVLMGLTRESMALSEEEKEVVAYHEGGHAVLAYVLEHADPVHKVTILPTGMALGVTQQLPLEERHIYKREYITDSLVVRLGGRIAEELVFGHLSTGAQNDLVGVTELARKMVREWGMSDRIGPMAWGSQGAVFLGEDLVHTRDYSDETARVIDEEVERILREEENRARKVLGEYREGLEAIARALLEHETLDGAEVGSIVDTAMGHKVGGPRHYVRADGTEAIAEPLPEGDSLSEVAD